MSAASTAVERHEAERDVGDRLGEHAADAEHHARPNCGSVCSPAMSSRVPVHHVRDEQVDVAVVGRAAREQLVGGVAHRRGVGEAERARGRARSCGRCGRR